MSSDSDVYWLAARIVDSGWLKGHDEKDGSCCLLQALIVASRTPKGEALPVRMQRELDNALAQFPYYRLLRHISPGGVSVMDLIMTWNDAWWRRKSTVVKLLIMVGTSIEAPVLAEVPR